MCHNVLQYLDGPGAVTAAVAALVAAVRPGGAVSLLAPNPASEVLVAAVRHLDPAGALARLGARTAPTVTFDHEVALLEPGDVAQALVEAGCAAPARYGVRCLTDLVADERKHDPAFYADLERLELALCDREPFVRTARMWQLVARRLPSDEWSAGGR